MNILRYRQSAASWNEALPLGNGRLGAMVFGGVTLERLQLNEDSVWSGGFTDRVNPDARRYLPQIRQLLSEGRIACCIVFLTRTVFRYAGFKAGRNYDRLPDRLVRCFAMNRNTIESVLERRNK